jgi:hypothetical protein
VRSSKSALGQHLRGGLFGPLPLLKGLANWRQVYLTAWRVPPLLTRPASQLRDGVRVEVFCGAAASTAVQWARPRPGLETAKSRDREYLKRRHAEAAERAAAAAAAASQGAGGRPGVLGRLAGLLGLRGGDRGDVNGERAEGAEDRFGAPQPCFEDGSLWAADPVEPMELEVAVKITKDGSISADVARAIFAEEVVANIDHLASFSRWIVHKLKCVDVNHKSHSSSERDIDMDEHLDIGDVVVFPVHSAPSTSLFSPTKASGVGAQQSSSAHDVYLNSAASQPVWASDAFMANLRVTGECVAECAVLWGQEVDDGDYLSASAPPAAASGYRDETMTVDESIFIAREMESRPGGGVWPALYPALLSHLKNICGLSKEHFKEVMSKKGQQASSPAVAAAAAATAAGGGGADKWWGGGEGWRGSDSEAAHDMDPTAKDYHRTSVYSTAAQRVQGLVGLRENAPKIYVPCKIRFSLLCFSEDGSHELHRSEASVDGGNRLAGEATMKAFGKQLKNVHSLFQKAVTNVKMTNKMTKSSRGLVIGNGSVICRLIGTTVWLSADAAAAIWSCAPGETVEAAGQAVGGRTHAPTRNLRELALSKILERAAETSLRKSRDLCTRTCPDYVAGYTEAYISLLLLGGGEVVQRLLPDAARMLDSLAHKAQCVTQTLRMLRHLLPGVRDGHGDSLHSLHVDGLTATLVLHACLSVRLLISAPQCVHFLGGCFLVLTAVDELETTLNLGRYALSNGMRSGYKMHSDKEAAAWKLPVPDLDPEVALEMHEMKVTIDGATGVRRALGTGSHALSRALECICKLEGLCAMLTQALSEDVHRCCEQTIGAFVNAPIQEHYGTEGSQFLSALLKRMNNLGLSKSSEEPLREVENLKSETKVPTVDRDSIPAVSSDPAVTSKKDSVEMDEHASAFLSALENSSNQKVKPISSEGHTEENHLRDDEDDYTNPNILKGRKRVSKAERLQKSKGIYEEIEGSMLDDLRSIF